MSTGTWVALCLACLLAGFSVGVEWRDLETPMGSYRPGDP